MLNRLQNPEAAGAASSPASPKKRTIAVSARRRPPVSQALRVMVWEKYYPNQYTAVCPVCKTTEIKALAFECGHILAHAKGGATDITNLRPICATCNRSMGDKGWDEFESAINGHRQLRCRCVIL
jgi:5-methylcytosine-specific restriction endonuclease McrA